MRLCVLYLQKGRREKKLVSQIKIPEGEIGPFFPFSYNIYFLYWKIVLDQTAIGLTKWTPLVPSREESQGVRGVRGWLSERS